MRKQTNKPKNFSRRENWSKVAALEKMYNNAIKRWKRGTLLGPRTPITHGLQRLMGCILPGCIAVPNIIGSCFVASVCTPLPTRTQQLPTLLRQQCWELLRPFARNLSHCKACKLLALFKIRVFTGDASIACAKEDGLDMSSDKFQHKNIKPLCSSYSYAYIYHGLFHLAQYNSCYAHAYIAEPRVTDTRLIQRDTSLLQTVFLVPGERKPSHFP